MPAAAKFLQWFAAEVHQHRMPRERGDSGPTLKNSQGQHANKGERNRSREPRDEGVQHCTCACPAGNVRCTPPGGVAEYAPHTSKDDERPELSGEKPHTRVQVCRRTKRLDKPVDSRIQQDLRQ